MIIISGVIGTGCTMHLARWTDSDEFAMSTTEKYVLLPYQFGEENSASCFSKHIIESANVEYRRYSKAIEYEQHRINTLLYSPVSTEPANSHTTNQFIPSNLEDMSAEIMKILPFYSYSFIRMHARATSSSDMENLST